MIYFNYSEQFSKYLLFAEMAVFIMPTNTLKYFSERKTVPEMDQLRSAIFEFPMQCPSSSQFVHSVLVRKS